MKLITRKENMKWIKWKFLGISVWRKRKGGVAETDDVVSFKNVNLTYKKGACYQNGACVNVGCHVYGDCKIGKHTSVGRGTHLEFNTLIGSYCSVSWNVTIGALQHPLTGLTTHYIAAEWMSQQKSKTQSKTPEGGGGDSSGYRWQRCLDWLSRNRSFGSHGWRWCRHRCRCRCHEGCATLCDRRRRPSAYPSISFSGGNN